MKRTQLFAVTAAAGAQPDDVLHEILEPDFAIDAGAIGGGVSEAPPVQEAIVQAERSIAGAILADNAVYDDLVESLSPDDFLDPTSRLIYTLAADIVEGRVPDVSVADAIALATLPAVQRLISLEGLQALARDGKATLDVIKARAKAVADAAAQRRLSAAAQKVQGIVDDDRSVQEKASDIQAVLSSAAEVKTLPVVSLGGAAVEALRELAERAQNGQSGMGIPMGFADLDAMTGGLHGGQLIVLAARPGIGKTALAMSAGLHMAHAGWHVAMASMEMLAKELSKRAVSVESGVDSHAIRMGALSEDEWVAAVAAAERLQQLPFEVVDLPSITLAALFGLCRRLRRAGKLDALVVDYLQIMESANPRATREQQVAENSRGLKKLAMALGIPVILLSQLNRTVETRLDKRPQMSDLRESGAIEQDADVIMFVHRDETPGKGAIQRDSAAEIIVAKQREGPTGIVEVLFRKNTTHFVDRPAYAGADPLLRIAA